MLPTIQDILSSDFIFAHTNGQYDNLDDFLHACGTSFEKIFTLSDDESAIVNTKVQEITNFASLTELITVGSEIYVQNNPIDENELEKFL